MRIIRGQYRGKRIKLSKNFSARPTTDFAKEALFNILENRFDFIDLKILDLFSGTGSISFEFLSRGCKNVTAVEKNYNHYAFIKKFGEELFGSDLIVLNTDAIKFIQKKNMDYDIIFADPPYDLSIIKDIPNMIFDNKSLPKKACLIIEHSSKINFTNMNFFGKLRKYGGVNFSFFSK